MKKIALITINILPIFLMIYLIKPVQNDWALALVYAAIVIASYAIKNYPKDEVVFAFGFVGMIVSEYFFVHSGVEVFQRTSLFGFMPIWLPILWGYGFVIIKRVVGWLAEPQGLLNHKNMEENYIQIYCTYIAHLLNDEKITEDDMKFLIIEFNKVAANIHSRQDLIDFISKHKQYPQLDKLVRQLQNLNYQFIFN